MNLRGFVEELARDGIQLWADGDRLRYRGPKDRLGPARIEALREHKQELLQLLKPATTAAGPSEELWRFPLSHGQRALWYLYRTAPDSAAYNTASCVRILGPLNTSAFHSASRRLLERHPVLRSCFSMRDGQPVQTVHPPAADFFQQVDASRWTEEELHRQVAEAYRAPFCLEQGPVARVHVFQRSAEDYVFLLAIHHIACDAWSTWILLDELRELYLAEREGRQAALPPPPASYADFVRWQAEMLASPAGEQHWEYWRDRLRGELPALNLATDRPRPRVQTLRGATHRFRIPDLLAERLRELARREGATRFTVCLAAFAALLHRYTGDPEILVGSGTSGRNQARFASAVGYFVNMVVMRADLRGGPTFRQLLGRIRETVLGALQHQDYPFSLLVERLRPARDLSRSPIFQVAFGWQRPQRFQEVADMWSAADTSATFDWADLRLQPFPLDQQEGQFDLALEILESPRSLSGFLKYNTDLFDAATIARLAGHFQNLLQAVVADPEQSVAAVPLLSPRERHQLLVEWNTLPADPPHPCCDHQAFEAQAEQAGESLALACDGRQLTYRQLNERANRLAHYLRRQGAGPEDHVAVCLERSLDSVIALLAILKAGAAYLPLDPAAPRDRLAFLLEDSRAHAVLSQSRLAAVLAGLHPRTVWLDAEWDHIAAQPDANPPPAAQLDHAAYLLYTSGSTGQPKGVVVPHRALAHHAYHIQRHFALTAADRVLQFSAMSFDQSLEQILPPLACGAAVVMRGKPLWPAAELWRKIAEHALTVINLPPAYFRQCVQSPPPREELASCRSLRLVILGGDVLLPETLARWRALGMDGVRLLNAYGPTEATITSTLFEVPAAADFAAGVPIGKPVGNTRVYVLDPRLQPVPVGVPGELYLGGSRLARGYWNRPDLTAERYLPDPFVDQPEARMYRTGDVVRYRADGNLEFLGRTDDQVKIHGYRIELGEVEAALAAVAHVREAAVVARTDHDAEKCLVAYVVPQPGSSLSASELRAALRPKLPDYMLPSAFVFLDRLPLTPHGKVDRKLLPQPRCGREAAEAEYAPPQTEVERTLARIWAEVLGVERVGIHDRFFDLGGGSLKSLQIVAKASAAGLVPAGATLSPEMLFEHATIAELARLLELQEPGTHP